MSKLQVIGLLLCIFVYVAYRSEATVSAVPETQKVVSGVLAELAEAELSLGWQYDQARRESLDLARKTEERGSFSPPNWMSEKLSELSVSSTVEDVRSAYRWVSERLWEAQDGPEYDRGKDYVRRILYPKEEDYGICKDCDGTGKVGDGRVFTECLNCGGDGKIDKSDRKEEVFAPETSTKESAGDQVSRRPTSDSVGSSRDSYSNRIRLPRIRSLLKR